MFPPAFDDVALVFITMLRSTSVLQLFIYVVVYSADSDFNSHPLRSYEYRLSEKTHYGHLFEATDFNFEVQQQVQHVFVKFNFSMSLNGCSRFC